jgi:lysophospholipase L1-like esterase
MVGLAGLVLTAGLVAAALAWRQQVHAKDSLARHLKNIQQPRPDSEVACASVLAGQPLVLLVLGQSNAGNHGEIAGAAGPWATVLTVSSDVSGQARCHRSSDPLPGGTGEGHSVWTRLPAALSQLGVTRPLVVGLLGVDASSIEDWTDPSGPLPPRLRALVQPMRAAGLAPQWVLWQHGESNARAGTRSEVYAQRLQMLASQLVEAGVDAPIILAQSTLCRSAPSPAIRAATQQVVRQAQQRVDRPSATAGSASASSPFLLGPDTDALSDALYRRDGCHFSQAGLNAAATQWAQVLAPLAGPSR